MVRVFLLSYDKSSSLLIIKVLIVIADILQNKADGSMPSFALKINFKIY